MFFYRSNIPIYSSEGCLLQRETNHITYGTLRKVVDIDPHISGRVVAHHMLKDPLPFERHPSQTWDLDNVHV
jgi:hypothetical protein